MTVAIIIAGCSGSDKNIKLTTKDDMELFKAYLAMDNKDDYLK